VKKLILLSSVLFSLAACQKEETIAPKAKPTTSTTAATPKNDSIPDDAALKVKLFKDSSTYDETALVFDHLSTLNYSDNNDAPYFSGFGQVSLTSISHDGRDMAIYRLPYSTGMSIELNVNTKAEGTYHLQISYEKNIPANIQVWVMDTYLKDSTNVCTKNYNFNVTKADTNSFGSKRFKLVLR
jgi:trimeric autotransporter adhesin